ncbi:LOW QUALITY PROTEIN: active regulator of SIRT1 [Ciconia maguari]
MAPQHGATTLPPKPPPPPPSAHARQAAHGAGSVALRSAEAASRVEGKCGEEAGSWPPAWGVRVMSASLLRARPGAAGGAGVGRGDTGGFCGGGDTVIRAGERHPPGLQRGRDGPRTAGAARRRKRAPEPHGRNKATVKGRVVKSAIEEYHKKAAVNHLRANLQYMLKRQFVCKTKPSQNKVLAQNRGRKSKDQPPKKAAKKKPEGTVFTEEDFRKFEREYFGRP